MTDFLADFLKCLKSLIVIFLERLFTISFRTAEISSIHEMCLLLVIFSYFGKFKPNTEILDFGL